MGSMKRLIRRAALPQLHAIELGQNIVKYGFKAGVTIHKAEMEADIELAISKTSLYKKGQYRGKKDGYVEASNAYAEKLKTQARHFQDHQEVAISKFTEYEDLISEYERYIDSLKQKSPEDADAGQKLEVALQDYSNLKALKQ
ncbi:hypothetical protein [Exiguobacterium flavidum]|uniref:hypothetical protein n=1 Tax=Exiguobacterium flavidum TaxID=2184695 RepID=UPI000DF7BBA6|nr:hypothetical protein [Exiguobacterium flavidum]